MNNKGPITVVADGYNVKNATGQNILLNTRYPFSLIDSTKKTSYQVVELYLAQDPPNASTPAFGPPNSLTTKVYSFAHGYDYVPMAYFLISLDNFITVEGSTYCYIDSDVSIYPQAYFFISVSKTDVNFYITKSVDTAGGNVNLSGKTIYVRTYISASDLLGGEVPLKG